MVSQTQSLSLPTAAAGLRALDPLRDLGAVADLVEEVFADELGPDSRHIMRDLRMMHTLRPLMWMVNSIAPDNYDFLGGYVWEEEGRIVGNLSLSPLSDGDMIVANVAVSAPYRRRGIARALMNAAIAQAQRRHVHRIWLQVNEQNRAAIALYDSLNFRYRDTVVEMQAEQPDPATLPVPRGVRLVAPINERWHEAYELSRRAQNTTRFGQGPQSSRSYRPQPKSWIERLWQRVVPPARERWWAMEGDDLRGLLTILRRRNRQEADRVELLVAPEGEGQVEGAMVNLLTERLRYRAVVQSVVAGQQVATRDALRRAGFVERRTLNQMRLTLDGAGWN
ncbi:MAG: GNAT family N-acetyltransferase [Anaerolineales bacterium]|nr:GNAT family N-acetyltransferase [Anaerolineales bacterium]MCB9127868.1 GNAT family N-acetyltransferase [Ardenticatenales bacterium]